MDREDHAFLLLFKNNTFFHFDSHFHTNYKYARKAAQKFSIIFGVHEYNYQILEFIQQGNGYDCAVFINAFMDFLYTKKAILKD
jgi:hypothetical protein